MKLISCKLKATNSFLVLILTATYREYAMLRLADGNVAKKSRIMMLLISV